MIEGEKNSFRLNIIRIVLKFNSIQIKHECSKVIVYLL